MPETSTGWLQPIREMAQTLSQFRPANARLKRLYLSDAETRKLHLGCGRHAIEGWLNTDRFCRHGIVYVDVTKNFALPSNTFDYVYCEHTIEHLPYEGGLNLLRESQRVLRSGGTLRLVTPDFVFLKSLHDAEKTPLQKEYLSWSMKEWVGTASDVPQEMFVINNFVRAWGHQFIYDKATLTQSLLSAGFTSIEQCELNASRHSVLRGLENEDRMPEGFLRLESLVLEAAKP